MAAISWADEFLLLEIEGAFDQIEPFLAFEDFEMFDVDETESRPREPIQWGYRVPCPGVRYYSFD